MQFARKWGRQRGAARRKGTGRVTAGSELPLGLAESLGDAAWDSEIKPGNSCGNLGSDCRSAAQLRLPAACRANWEHLLQASWEQRGDWRGRRRELSPLPAPNLPPCPPSICAWLVRLELFLPQEGRRARGLVQRLSFPKRASAPTGPWLGEFQQVWGALSCQILAELLNG